MMGQELENARARVNHTRYEPGQRTGHYESFFQRANHPTRPLAFWIRYTIFSPELRPEDALGELWAICFDGETGHHVAVKKEVPFSRCVFDTSRFFVDVDGSRLEPGVLKGSAASNGRTISWDLSFSGDEESLFLLPLDLYGRKLPRAKTVVGLPMALYGGMISVDGAPIEVTDWLGSQNHNWGSRHTDLYAWGQVAGFDTHPGSFLEVATARIKVGPFLTPYMTPMVLRHEGGEFALNSLLQTIRAHGSFHYFEWTFRSESKDIEIEGAISAPRDAFAGLRYYNPPGGTKHCLNSKIASCEIEIKDKRSGKIGAVQKLSASRRAAFEILTDDQSHGIEISA